MRRIAIVLQDLPASVARNLLVSLPPETRHRVQREIAALVDVDPIERRRALESFTGSVRREAVSQSVHANASPPADLTQDVHAARGVETKSFASASEALPQSPTSLDFFDSVSDEELLKMLGEEHPQTKAVVLAQIQPARAAALLPRFGSSQRQDLLARIGRLETLPDEMLTEIAHSFRQRVDRLLASRALNLPFGLAGIQAEVESTHSATAAQHVPRAAVAVSPRLKAILAEMPASPDSAVVTAAIPAVPLAHRQPVSPSRSASAEEAETAEERLRRITRDDAEPFPAQDTISSTTRRSFSADEIHQELLQMPAGMLCSALGRVSTRTALLTLCGLPSRVADAAIARLPRAQANQVRQQLMTVGNLEIREIDFAKEQVAAAARLRGHVPATRDTKLPNTVAPTRVAIAMA